MTYGMSMEDIIAMGIKLMTYGTSMRILGNHYINDYIETKNKK